MSLEVLGPRPPWDARRPFKITPNSVLGASIAFMLRRVRPALLWDFSGSRTVSTLAYPVPSLGTSTGSRTSAVSPASGFGASLFPSGGPAAGGTWMCGDPLTRGIGLRAALWPVPCAPRPPPPSPLLWPGSSGKLDTLAQQRHFLGSSGASLHPPCGLYPLPLGGVSGVWG